MNFWLIILVCSCSSVYSCFIPNIPNGVLEAKELNKTLTEGLSYDDYEAVSVKCNPGFALRFVDSAENSVHCHTDVWNKPFLVCQKLCWSSELVDYTAFPVNCKTSNGTSIQCTQFFEAGSSAEVQCYDRYEFNKLGKPKPFVCLPSGKWNQRFYRCDAICGLQTPQATLFISQGQTAKVAEAPWNMAIYKSKDQNLDLICGASILTERVVISAAHCFYDELMGIVTLQDIGSFKIVAGKNLRVFHEVGTLETQSFGVAKIIADKDYKGKTGLNKGDIAYVVLDNLIKFKIHIAPICIKPEEGPYSDWFLQNGQNATVFGWGYTASGGEPSDELKSLVIPFVPLDKCRQEASSTFVRYVLDDKLCFGYKDGSGVCKGDSGAGLVVSEDVGRQKKFYLRGIVSLGPSNESGCDFNFYALYTDIKKYIGSIYKIISEHPATLKAVLLLNEENYKNKIIVTTTEPNPIYGNGGKPCVVPTTPNGRVTFGVDTDTFNATLKPGQLHHDFEPVHLICDYDKSPSNNEEVTLVFIFCIDGRWDKRFPKCK